VVHGHFYQPPRENPWRDEVEAEPSALPFHNWNERITSECYLPVASARVLDAAGHVARKVNLYEWLSFNTGATLHRWLERHAPEVNSAMLEGDRASARRLDGHGNALAMPYHHVILPLASRRDKLTEVRWGLADFRRRFGRDAEGMWLPETAVDDETLVVLAEEGVKFTILAPRQVEKAPAHGEALRFDAGGGRELSIFVYDGSISAGVAFGNLLRSGDEIAARLAPAPAAHGHAHKTPRSSLHAVKGAKPPKTAGSSHPAWTLTSLATDGETFGHHHKFGEMALARAFAVLAERPDVRVENFASVLARHAPRRAVKLVEPSSWSCPHGVGRWCRDCGCRFEEGTQQAWRAPLRDALNWLAIELDQHFESAARPLLGDPWRARDAFGEVAALDAKLRHLFVSEHMRAGADADLALELLDSAAARLNMFSSCAWFFDDIARIEPVSMLRQAAFAIDKLGNELTEAALVARLAAAPSNDPARGDGAAVYRQLVAPMRPRA
jgi:alpha-amylase/alpha-mannosidase (GH57 family)